MLTEKIATFGCHRFLLTQGLLFERERRVILGCRARDILATLLEYAGEVVPTGVLMKRVWRNIYVEDTALRVQISKLRKVLARDKSVARHIETVTALGYRFAAPLSIHERADDASHREMLKQVVGYLERSNLLIELDNGNRMIAPAAWEAFRD